MSDYLVTGGCGFIGSHLVDALLAGGHGVRILDDLSTGDGARKPAAVELVVGDVSDTGVVAQAMRGMDGCFHLAAIASVERGNQDWLGTHRTNLTGSITVFDAARAQETRAAIPVVYASSAAVYGDNRALPLVETGTTKPLSAYGADKLGCEQHAVVAGRIHSVPTLGLRLFNVYGPRQDPSSPYSGVISIFASRFRKGEPVTILGDGAQARDFVFVADVVRAFLLGMKNTSTDAEVCNVCSGRSTTILELGKTIATLAGVPFEPLFQPARSGDIRESIGSPAKARRSLGFEAATVLESGLRITLASM